MSIFFHFLYFLFVRTTEFHFLTGRMVPKPWREPASFFFVAMYLKNAPFIVSAIFNASLPLLSEPAGTLLPLPGQAKMIGCGDGKRAPKINCVYDQLAGGTGIEKPGPSLETVLGQAFLHHHARSRAVRA